MNTDEILTEFLKTGKLPELIHEIPIEKFVKTNDGFKIHYRDYYDELFKSNNLFDEFNSEQLNVIISNSDIDFKSEFLRILVCYPERGIAFIKSDNLNNAVFKEQNTEAKELMQFLISMYLALIYEADNLNIVDKTLIRLLTYMESEKDYLEDLFDRTENIVPQQKGTEQIEPINIEKAAHKILILHELGVLDHLKQNYSVLSIDSDTNLSKLLAPLLGDNIETIRAALKNLNTRTTRTIINKTSVRKVKAELSKLGIETKTLPDL